MFPWCLLLQPSYRYMYVGNRKAAGFDRWPSLLSWAGSLSKILFLVLSGWLATLLTRTQRELVGCRFSRRQPDPESSSIRLQVTCGRSGSDLTWIYHVVQSIKMERGIKSTHVSVFTKHSNHTQHKFLFESLQESYGHFNSRKLKEEKQCMYIHAHACLGGQPFDVIEHACVSCMHNSSVK